MARDFSIGLLQSIVFFVCNGFLIPSDASGQLSQKVEDLLPKVQVLDLETFKHSAKELKNQLKSKWKIELDGEVQYAIQPPRRDTPNRKPDALLYLKDDYKGSTVLVVYKGDKISDLSTCRYLDGTELKDWDNKVRSFQIIGKCEVELFQNKDFGGKSIKDNKSLAKMPEELTTNRASSCEVQ